MTTTIKVKGSALPADQVTPWILTDYKMTEGSTTKYIDVPGRSKPVVVLRPLRGRTGTIALVLTDEAQAAALRALLRRNVTYTLTDTDRASYNMDFVIGDGGFSIELEPETRRRFTASLEVVEQ